MLDCQHCKYAEWDCEDFNFGGHVRHWFLTGCRKEEEPENCEWFEEYVRDEDSHN